ncbi:MAG: hypothetical protein AAB594_01700 [Patescibacteria group bacterium]
MSALETLDVGQANELKLAFRRAGWSSEDVKRFCEGHTAADIRDFIFGHEVDLSKHLINCSALPFLPEGWSAERHIRRKSLAWDPMKIKLWSAQELDLDRPSELLHRFEKERVLNGNVLDYLLKYPYLIPKAWGEACVILFLGTKYQDRKSTPCVSGIWHPAEAGKWVRINIWTETCSSGLYVATLIPD